MMELPRLRAKLHSVRIEDMQMTESLELSEFLNRTDSSQGGEGTMIVMKEKEIDEFAHQALLGGIINRTFEEPSKCQFGEDRQQVILSGIGDDGMQDPLRGGRGSKGVVRLELRGLGERTIAGGADFRNGEWKFACEEIQKLHGRTDGGRQVESRNLQMCRDVDGGEHHRLEFVQPECKSLRVDENQVTRLGCSTIYHHGKTVYVPLASLV